MPRRRRTNREGHHAQALHRSRVDRRGRRRRAGRRHRVRFGGVLDLVSEGGVVDKALLESFQAAGVGEVGFLIHGLVGGVAIPLIALVLLVVSFFVQARGARIWPRSCSGSS